MRRTRSFYINTLLQELRAEDVDKYKNYMRISKETFNMLLEKVRLYIEKQDTKMRQSISAEERLDVTLRFLATKSVRSFTNSFVQLHFDILFELVCLLFPAIFTMCFYLQNILMILIPKNILIGYFPSKSIKVFRKIGWSSIPSKSIKVHLELSIYM